MKNRRCRLRFLIAASSLIGPVAIVAATDPAPAIFSWPAQTLAATRARLSANPADPQLAPALATLRSEADAALATPPASVMDKKLTAASGDKHDYFSFGPYWWPDPAKPDGLPYIRRDGKTNPASRTGTDQPAFNRTSANIWTLSLAYYFTGYEPCAAHAALLARVWFLDPATRMNPNLNHAQAIPGHNDGRDVGVIEALVLINLTDGLALLESAASPSWTAVDRDAMRAWLSTYLDWLITSPNGLGARNQPNNLGTWYDAQVTQLALVLGRTRLARDTVTTALTSRLARQAAPDGSQRRELNRASPLGYSTMNTRGFLILATQAGHVGIDWWQHKVSAADTAPRLRVCLERLAPYANPDVRWSPPGWKGDNQTGARAPLRELLALASLHYTDDAFRALFPSRLDSRYATERWNFFS
ncbi:MAG: alginate lyase family protein, partial [Opitutaceae bacterium]|nr:alginate lyase family protein [Opitutaceae bacterium]